MDLKESDRDSQFRVTYVNSASKKLKAGQNIKHPQNQWERHTLKGLRSQLIRLNLCNFLLEKCYFRSLSLDSLGQIPNKVWKWFTGFFILNFRTRLTSNDDYYVLKVHQFSSSKILVHFRLKKAIEIFDEKFDFLIVFFSIFSWSSRLFYSTVASM